MIRISETTNAAYLAGIKPTRNFMRRFNYHSMLNELLTFLNMQPPKRTSGQQKLPWVAERLLLYILRDLPNMYGGEIATQRTVSEAINRCWRANDAAYAGHIEIENLTLFIRSIFISQAPDQVGLNPWAFARQMLLAESLEPNSRIVALLTEKARMPLDQFLDLATLAWIHSDQETPWFSKSYLTDAAEICEKADINHFLSGFSFSLERLQTDLREASGRITADEWFQPTPLYRTPCIQWKNAIVPFGRPAIRRYFETFVSDTVDQSEDQKIWQAWENKIERYVFNIASSLDAEVLNEQSIRKRFALGTGLCCDVAIIFPDAIICIEVKTKNLSSDIPAAATVRDMRAKLKTTVLSADKQLLTVATALQMHPQFKALPVYSLIATSAELLLGGADDLTSPYWLERGIRKPLVVSLDDIDWLIEGHRIEKFHMVSALEDFQVRLDDKPFALYSLSQLQAEEKYCISTPEHLVGIFDDRLNRLQARSKLRLLCVTVASETHLPPKPPH